MTTPTSVRSEYRQCLLTERIEAQIQLERAVMEYLQSPERKVVGEAARER